MKKIIVMLKSLPYVLRTFIKNILGLLTTSLILFLMQRILDAKGNTGALSKCIKVTGCTRVDQASLRWIKQIV